GAPLVGLGRTHAPLWGAQVGVLNQRERDYNVSPHYASPVIDEQPKDIGGCGAWLRGRALARLGDEPGSIESKLREELRRRKWSWGKETERGRRLAVRGSVALVCACGVAGGLSALEPAAAQTLGPLVRIPMTIPLRPAPPTTWRSRKRRLGRRRCSFPIPRS